MRNLTSMKRIESLCAVVALAVGVGVGCGGSVAPADSGMDATRPVDGTAMMNDTNVPPMCANIQEGQPCAMEGEQCGGPCSDPCQFCNVWRCSQRRWSRLEVFPLPCRDGGPTMDGYERDAPTGLTDVVVVDSSFRPDPTAIVLIQEQGGVAGTGPAVAVRGDGSVYVWVTQSGLRADALDLMRARTLPRVSLDRVAELFALWQGTSRRGLPHGPGQLECGVSITVKACAGCMSDEFSYVQASQVTPELNAFWGWYARNVILDRGDTPPNNYCSGG